MYRSEADFSDVLHLPLLTEALLGPFWELEGVVALNCVCHLRSYPCAFQLIKVMSCTTLTVRSDCGYDLSIIFHTMELRLVFVCIYQCLARARFGIEVALLLVVTCWYWSPVCLLMSPVCFWWLLGR